MQQIRLEHIIATIVILVFALTFSYSYPQLGFKTLAFTGFLGFALLVTVLPIKMGLVFLFCYIGLEGFLKIVSNYNPVLHIGSDLLVLLLSTKVVVGLMTNSRLLGTEKPPFIALFAAHYTWVLICLFNPYSLGIVPSLAGAKIYTVMPLLYFFGFYFTSSLKDLKAYIAPVVSIAIIHTVFAIYQAYIGPESVLSLHPRYGAQLAKYADYAFRPFGLTNLPGGPAVYLSLAFPLIVYSFLAAKSLWWRLALLLYTPLGAVVFILCQIRSSLIKMILACGLIIAFAFYNAWKTHNRRLLKIISGSLVVGMTLFLFTIPKILQSTIDSREENQEAFERSMTTFNLDIMRSARKGTWNRLVTYAGEVPFGVGFSRVGAAAGKFYNERLNDKYFGVDHFFADNFWIASTIEIGLPGMLIMTLILLLILWRGLLQTKNSTLFEHRMAILSIWSALFAIIIGLWGAEGILYNPDSSFFWFFSGVMLKLGCKSSNEVVPEG